MAASVLPPYPELRRLYLSGQSYTELAIKYGCTRGGVREKLRRGTLAAGLTWPIEDPNSARKQVVNWQQSCTVSSVALRAALIEWQDAMNRSFRSLALEIGVDPSVLTAVVRGDRKRVRKDYAARIFTAIGESPHPSLVKYQPLLTRGKVKGRVK